MSRPGAPTPTYDVLTVQEAAEYCRINPRTITSLATRGDIPAKQLGKLWRFPRKALEAWMNGEEVDL